MAKTPGLNLPFGIDPVNPVPVDSNYGPYANTTEAIASIPLALRYDGLTVQITGSGNYWWEASDLSDLGLKPKSTGGGTTIINNNNSGDTGKLFYLVPSVASDIPGYFLASESPSAGPTQTIVQANIGTSDTLIASFATEPGVPGSSSLPTGIAGRVIHGKVDAANQEGRYLLELYKRDVGGTETLLRSGYSDSFSNSIISEIPWTFVASNSASLDPTDRLVFKLYTARVSGPTTVTITSQFEGSTVSYVKTTLVENHQLPINITKINLLTLKNNNQLLPGATYNITDAQDVDYINNESIYVKAISNNQIDGGSWVKRTNLKATGKFSIISGTSGNISAVTINGTTNLLSGSIPFAVSRYQTAVNLASNINAGTGTHNWSAYVIQGYDVVDIPTIILEYQIPTASTFTLTTTQTGLVITASNNIINPANGAVQTYMPLEITYDVTSDRITEALDPIRNIRMTCSDSFLISYGSNPITTFWWGDNRFRNWTIVDSYFLNCWILGNGSYASLTDGYHANNNITECAFQDVAFAKFSANNIVRCFLTNISAGNKFDFNGNQISTRGSITIQNITGGRAAIGSSMFSNNSVYATNNAGSNVTVSISNLGTTSNQNFIFLGNSIENNITISTQAAGAFNVRNNKLAVLTATSLTSFTFIDNITNSNNIAFTGNSLHSINMTGNILYGQVTTSLSSSTSVSVSINGNTITSGGINIQAVCTGNISLTNNKNLTFFTGTNLTIGSVNIAENAQALINLSGIVARSYPSITILYSIVHSLGNDGTSQLNTTLNIRRSEISSNIAISTSIDDPNITSTINIINSRLLSIDTPSFVKNTLALRSGSTLNIQSSEIYAQSYIFVPPNKTTEITLSRLTQVGINDFTHGGIYYSNLTTTNLWNGGAYDAPVNDFTGDFNFLNWVQAEVGTTGSTSTITSTQLDLFPGDDGSLIPGGYVERSISPTLRYGTITFDWSITLNDDSYASSLQFASLGASGEIFFPLVDGGGLVQTGSSSNTINELDIFVFRAYTLNDGNIVAQMTITNVVFTPLASAAFNIGSGNFFGSDLYLAPEPSVYINMQSNTIKASTVTIKCTGANILDLNGTNIISSGVHLVSDGNIELPSTTIQSSTINLSAIGTITFNKCTLSNNVLISENFLTGGKTGQIFCINSIIENNRIRLDLNSSDIVPQSFSFNLDNTRISQLVGTNTHDGFTDLFYFPNTHGFNVDACYLKNVTISQRKFSYTVKHTAALGNVIGNQIIDYVTVLEGLATTKVILSSFGNNLTYGVGAEVAASTFESTFTSPIDVSTPYSAALLDFNKFYEENLITGPFITGTKRVFGLRGVTNNILTGTIVMTIEGYLADITK